MNDLIAFAVIVIILGLAMATLHLLMGLCSLLVYLLRRVAGWIPAAYVSIMRWLYSPPHLGNVRVTAHYMEGEILPYKISFIEGGRILGTADLRGHSRYKFTINQYTTMNWDRSDVSGFNREVEEYLRDYYIKCESLRR